MGKVANKAVGCSTSRLEIKANILPAQKGPRLPLNSKKDQQPAGVGRLHKKESQAYKAKQIHERKTPVEDIKARAIIIRYR